MQNPVFSKEQKLCKCVPSITKCCYAVYIVYEVTVSWYVCLILAALTGLLSDRKASDLTINLFGEPKVEINSCMYIYIIISKRNLCDLYYSKARVYNL